MGGGREGRLTKLPTICTKKKLTKNAVANSPAAWLNFDQLSCKFDYIGGVKNPPSAQPCSFSSAASRIYCFLSILSSLQIKLVFHGQGRRSNSGAGGAEVWRRALVLIMMS